MHRTHGGTDACIEPFDSQVIEKAELGADHVKDRHDRKTCRVGLANGRVYGRRPRRSVAAAENIRAYDEKLVRVQSSTWSDKSFPPALCGIQLGGRSMRRGRKPGMEKDDVVLGCVKRAPGFVGDVKLLQWRCVDEG